MSMRDALFTMFAVPCRTSSRGTSQSSLSICKSTTLRCVRVGREAWEGRSVTFDSSILLHDPMMLIPSPSQFFAAYMKLLQSGNYVTRRQSLKVQSVWGGQGPIHSD